MRFFPILAEVLDEEDNRPVRPSWDVRLWPSEASVELLDRRKHKIAGKCMRSTYFRLIGINSPIKLSPEEQLKKSLRFLLGNLLEAAIIERCKQAGIFVASGVYAYIPDIDHYLKIDIIVLDPDTLALVILENKSSGDFNGKKEIIQGGKVRWHEVLQVCCYLNDFGNAIELKEAILQSWQARQELLKHKADLETVGNTQGDEYERVLRGLKKYATEVDFANLQRATDAPVTAKLTYEMRDSLDTREFDVDFAPVVEQGKTVHYPVIDGTVVKAFTLENMYKRYELQKEYHEQAKAEAVRRLAANGLPPPDPQTALPLDIESYRFSVMEEMQQLGPDWWPPAEYEMWYSPEKVEYLHQQKDENGKLLLSDDAYKKAHRAPTAKTHKWPGDIYCSDCRGRHLCIPVEYPERRHAYRDLLNHHNDDEEEGEAA